MDAFIALSIIIIALVALAGSALALGVDSRDGFADDRLQPTLR